MGSEEHPIRVAIVDGYPLFREAVRDFLSRQDGIVVVGVGENGESALALVAHERPDVLVLDIHLADWDGVEVTGQVREKYPSVKVLVLTDYEDVGSARALIAMGVSGYLRKTVSGDALLAAIRTVADNKTVFEATIAAHAYGPDLGSFTAREHEVLRLLALGLRNAEIANVLGRSEKTIEYHLTHILDKLGARSRAEALLKAGQYGLLSGVDRLGTNS